ncbi:hypothetical protein D9613_011890 [Agrocybe pediades]|uniref:F-box domain-containing protein n=1 Tax=Agrocybe pediades TaxID=84607 RepID=A0A8H4QM19_9AGAR|nr:hypothetical protein D9613_011890 [Agrocybe pediades]
MTMASNDDLLRSPIQAIPPELLQYVFLKNTELNIKHDRLKTARYSSQVCRSWRSLLLESPRVWSRLLDLDYLERSKDEWKEEVISRIGEAPIWIEGRIKPSTYPFMMSVLEKKWRNVEVLQLRGSLAEFPTADWSFLGREAPNLQRFFMHFAESASDRNSITSRQYSSVLFNNVAPRLRQFEFSSACPVEVSASWLSNLHSIIFSIGHTVSNIFSVLSNTPQLERLSFQPQSILAEDDMTKLPTINLPRLELLRLDYLQCSEALPFLEFINPSPRCLLSLEKHRSFGRIRHLDTPAEAKQLFRAALRWSKMYGAGYLPKEITLHAIRGIECIIFVWVHSHQSTKERPHCITTSLEAQLPHNDIDSNSFWRPIIDSYSFSSVTRLHLTILAYKSHMLHFLRMFSSVTDLESDAGSLDVLRKRSLDETLSHFFPQLHTLHFNPECAAASQIEIICDFLEHRVAIGLPVSVLYIDNFTGFIPDSGLDEKVQNRIQQIDGLLVKWDQKD